MGVLAIGSLLLSWQRRVAALLDSLNNGNPVSALAMDAAFAADCLDYFAGLATEIKWETHPHVRRQPGHPVTSRLLGEVRGFRGSLPHVEVLPDPFGLGRREFVRDLARKQLQRRRRHWRPE